MGKLGWGGGESVSMICIHVEVRVHTYIYALCVFAYMFGFGGQMELRGGESDEETLLLPHLFHRNEIFRQVEEWSVSTSEGLSGSNLPTLST